MAAKARRLKGQKNEQLDNNGKLRIALNNLDLFYIQIKNPLSSIFKLLYGAPLFLKVLFLILSCLSAILHLSVIGLLSAAT